MIVLNEFSDAAWGHSLSLKNDQLEMFIPFEIGPRILHFALTGGKNHFAGFPAHKTDPNPGKWHSFGGHRLWHGPEDIVRTYIPDNDPVLIEQSGSAVIVRQKIEARTQLQKKMHVQLDPASAHARVTHRIQNHNLFDVRLAAWAVSVMAVGGKAVIPLPARGSHDDNLSAQTSISLWAYTNPADPRWQFGQKAITFQQDPANSDPQKIGISRSAGWLAYLNHNQAFVKTCRFVENQPYPDENSAFEVYADHKCVELESLSPLTSVAPGNSAELVEDWYLFDGIAQSADEDEISQRLAQAFG